MHVIFWEHFLIVCTMEACHLLDSLQPILWSSWPWKHPAYVHFRVGSPETTNSIPWIRVVCLPSASTSSEKLGLILCRDQMSKTKRTLPVSKGQILKAVLMHAPPKFQPHSRAGKRRRWLQFVQLCGWCEGPFITMVPRGSSSLTWGQKMDYDKIRVSLHLLLPG